MKKIITLVALAVAGTAFANAESVDYIGRTESGTSGTNVWIKNSGNAFTLSLGWSGFTDNSSADFEIDSSLDYYLNGIQLNLTASGGRYDSTEANATEIEVFDGEELIATSKETLTAQAASEANDSNNAGGYASTFSFDGLILETDKTYTFKFVAKSEDPAYYLWSKKVDDNNSGVGNEKKKSSACWELSF